MSRKLALVVEDRYGKRLHRCEAARAAGFNVLECENGDLAIVLWEAHHPDLVLLDMELPGRRGPEILRWWFENDQLPQTRVVVISQHPEYREEAEKYGADFWDLRPDVDDLDRKVRKVAAELPPYRPDPRESTFDLSVVPGEKIRASLDGAAPVASSKELELKCRDEQDELYLQLQSADWSDWAQKRGHDLISKLLPQGIEAEYARAVTLAGDKERVRIRLTVPEDCSGVGYELLNQEPESFLVLKHPVSCQLWAARAHVPCLSREVLNAAAKLGQPIRVLLVGANTGRNSSSLAELPEVDGEIQYLAEKLPMWFGERGIRTEIEKPLLSSEATCDALRQRLERQSFDIVHFAGHAAYDEKADSRRGIYLWDDERRLAPRLFTVRELEVALRHSKVRFFYLDCCSGAALGLRSRSGLSRLPGVAHTLLRAGINSVLSFRIPIPSRVAAGFARSFYENLADTGEVDAALLKARQWADTTEPEVPICFSAVLYMSGGRCV